MTIESPPPPLDDPSQNDPLFCPSLKWGIIGCGRISHDFTLALKHLPTQTVIACAARDFDHASNFASKHKISAFYGNYDDLLTNNDVEIVYVGNIHSFRRSIGEKVLKANKHCLLEKPFACNAEDARYLISLAQERNLFFMEGMWTRFFPAMEKARRLVYGTETEKGKIGEVSQVYSDFNFNASDSEEYPSSFVYNHKLGGGATLLVAPYPVAASMMFFSHATPDTIKAVGQVDYSTGVDLQATVVMNFPPTRNTIIPMVTSSNHEFQSPKLPGAGAALLSFGMLTESEEETMIMGTQGRLKICAPGHCPTKLVLTTKELGRGKSKEQRVFEFPLPPDTKEIKESGGWVYPNSAGLAYEAAAVARCVSAGRVEAPQYTWQEMLNNILIMDEIRLQLGVAKISG